MAGADRMARRVLCRLADVDEDRLLAIDERDGIGRAHAAGAGGALGDERPQQQRTGDQSGEEEIPVLEYELQGCRL